MDNQGFVLITVYRVEAEWLFNCSYQGSHVDTINTQTTCQFREVTQKIYGMNTRLVHASVKLKLSCTVYVR